MDLHSLTNTRVAVLGGAGFIGRHVVRELLNRGAAVRVVDTLVHGAADELDAELHVVDVRDEEALVSSLRTCQLVINMATVNVRKSLREPTVTGRAVADIGCVPPFAAVRAGCSRYAYVSSSEIYGGAWDGPILETALPKPQTTYGAGKLAGEHFASCAMTMHDLETIIVRPFNAYGPGCHLSGDAAEIIARAVIATRRGEPVVVNGDGLQTRDFTHVYDIARGIVDAVLTDACVNIGPVNLAAGIGLTVNEIVQAVGARGVHGPPRLGDLRRQLGNAERAMGLFGWRPRISWKDGLEQTVQDVTRRLGDA
jgi:UDP-glucose 4-epimerase